MASGGTPDRSGDDLLPIAVSDAQRAALLREVPELARAEERARDFAVMARQLRVTGPDRVVRSEC
jgi:hypothetical protein